jgi:hypothetical protein
MGEVISYVKTAIDELLLNAEIVGSDLVLTKMSGEIVTLDLSGVASVDQADIDAAVAALVNSAPGTLNTLGEIATALGNDANLASTLTTAIAAKADTTALTAAKLGAMGVVIHGATAGTARPAGYGAIHWIGSVVPTNSIDNDVWTDTSA